MNSSRCIILLNGNIPGKFLKYLHKDTDFIICADGAANLLKENKIKPDCIIGDFDSITPGVLKYFEKKKVRIIPQKDQEKNDFEKCLIFAIGHQFDSAIIIGMTGRRLDHTINNLSIMKRYSNKLNIVAIDKIFEIFYICSEYQCSYKSNELISILGLPDAKGVTTEGLLYSLTNEDLAFGVREGALNISNSENVMIKISDGNLLIFKKHFGKIKDILKPVM